MEPFPGYDEHKAAAEGQPEYVQKVYAYCKTPEHTTMALKQLEGSKKVTDQMRENDKSTEKKLVVQARIDAERRKAAELQATADDEKAAAVAEARKKRVDAERAQAEAERKAKIEAASGDADVEVAQTAAASKKQNACDAVSAKTRTSRKSSPRRRGRAAATPSTATPSTGSFPTGPEIRRPGLLPRVEGQRRRARGPAHRVAAAAAPQETEDYAQGDARRRRQDRRRRRAAAGRAAGRRQVAQDARRGGRRRDGQGPRPQ